MYLPLPTMTRPRKDGSVDGTVVRLNLRCPICVAGVPDRQVHCGPLTPPAPTFLS